MVLFLEGSVELRQLVLVKTMKLLMEGWVGISVGWGSV